MAILLLKNKVKLRLIISETGLTLSQLCQLSTRLKKGAPPLIKGRGRGRKRKRKQEHLAYLKDLVASQKDCFFFFHIIDVKIKLMAKFEQFRKNPSSIATVRKIIWLSGIS